MSVAVLELPGIALTGWIVGIPYVYCAKEYYIYDYIYLVIMSVFLLVIVCIWGKALRKRLKRLFYGKLNIFWLMFSVVEWWIVIYFLHLGFRETGSGVFGYMLISVFFIVLLMVVAAVLVAMRQAEKEVFLRNLQDAVMDVEYEKIKIENSRKSKEMHDLKHQIHVLESYLHDERYKDAEIYLHEITVSLDSYKITLYEWSGCPMVDVILSSNLDKAKKYGIVMNIDVSDLVNPLSDRDMSILMGNIMDNAVEAAMKAEEGARFINVHMIEKGRTLYINVENSVGQKPVECNGKFISSKMDKENHGWGLESIQFIVDKYDGTIDIYYDEHKFGIYLSFIGSGNLEPAG